ncbi:MAG: YdeI/OmpD-associated family protein [Flavisolibacter sp.]
MVLKEIEHFSPKDAKAWRNWLKKYHRTKTSIWLVYYKKHTDVTSISYNEAVDEALCFGWIDSTSKTLDADRYIQYFCKRKPTSVWSKINKAKVSKLIEEGRMTPAGIESIEIARQNGSWDILNEVDTLTIPRDLEQAFRIHQGSKKYFMGLSPSTRKAILQWLVLAKRPETRQKRIDEIALLAGKKQKPKQF